MSTSTISPHPCFSVGHSLNSFPKMLDHGVIHERLPFHHLWRVNVMSCHPGDRHPPGGVYGSILPTAYSSPLKIGHLKRKPRIVFQHLPTIHVQVFPLAANYQGETTPQKVNIDIKSRYLGCGHRAPGCNRDHQMTAYMFSEGFL